MSSLFDKKYDRYPGLSAFSDEQADIFFGREKEISELFNLVMAEKVVVLFAQSGMGKSSLLNAGIIPRLRGKNFFPVKVRLKDWSSEKESPAALCKQILEPYFKVETVPYKKKQEELSLWEYVKACKFPAGFNPVIIFDQFEEFFYFSATKREEFINELSDILDTTPPDYIVQRSAELLKGPDISKSVNWIAQPEIKMIFSIRSDRFFELNEISRQIPQVQRVRYELRPLTPEGAKECIIKPAEKPDWYFKTDSFKYSEKALEEIAFFLNKGKNEVETSQLQIICEEIEKKVQGLQDLNKTNNKEKQVVVTEKLYDSADGLKLVIDNYYNNRMAGLGDENSRKLVQDLFEKELLKDGRRVMLFEGIVKKSLGNNDDLVKKLLDQRLLREDYYKGEKVYEISHDTLIESVLKVKFQREEIARKEQEMLEVKNMDILTAKSFVNNYFVQLDLKDYKAARDALMSAIEIYDKYEEEEYVNAQIKTRIKLAKLYGNQGDSESGMNVLEEAKLKAIAIKNNNLHGQCYEVFAALKDKDQQLDDRVFECYKKALDLFKESRSYPDYARLCENIAVLMESFIKERDDKKTIELSIEYYTKAHEFYSKINDFPSIKRTKRSIKGVERLILPFAYLTEILTGEPHGITGDKTIFIGRSTPGINNDISFKEQLISRRHLIITPDLMINDLQSLNGTTINGYPLYYGVSQTLVSGDIIVMANSLPLLFTEPDASNINPPNGCWGVFINGQKKEIIYLVEVYYSISVKEEFVNEQNLSWLEIGNKKNENTLLELFIDGDAAHYKFSGTLPDQYSPEKADTPPWLLSTIMKDYEKNQRNYKEYHVIPDQMHELKGLSSPMEFLKIDSQKNISYDKNLFFQILLKDIKP